MNVKRGGRGESKITIGVNAKGAYIIRKLLDRLLVGASVCQISLIAHPKHRFIIHTQGGCWFV